MTTKNYIVLHKRRGEAPLGAIESWKALNPEYASLRASYAGRLDPMAEGKLLVLFGEECKKQKQYTKLDKVYEISVVLDLESDTGDVLGLPSYADVHTSPTKKEVRSVLRDATGTHLVPYPAFSSKPVNGVPLFMYALQGTLDTIQMPQHPETIYRISLLSLEHFPITLLQQRIAKSLETVPRSDEPSKALGADFRQEVIRAGWKHLFDHIPERSFMVMRLRVTCASGTYMRSLASRIGTALGTTGLALSINRTRIGRYTPLGLFGLWTKSY